MHNQTRSSRPKVKSGCKTCKVRRIKCDEKKPFCLRCTSTGRRCDGYSLFDNRFQVQVWSSGKASTVQRTLSMLPGIGDGVRYLEYYHHCARPTLSTSFDSDFWSRTTLQMAHSEPAVRHALVALGHLHKNEDGTLKHARSKFAAQHDSRTLLYYYNKAVRCLVDRMAQTSYPPEVGLATCVIFVCMEYLRGNYHTAFTHLTNGLKILSEQRERLRHDSPMTPMSMRSDSSSSSTSTSARSLIEDELRPIFMRAVASALMYGVGAEDYIDIPKPSAQYYQHLQFETVREVQLSCHELRNQSILHIRNMSRKVYDNNTPITAEDHEAQATILACQRAWYKALQGFEADVGLQDADKAAISALKTHYLAMYIWTDCVMEVRQTPFDAHLDAFEDLLHHAKMVLDFMDDQKAQSATRFTFEISLIPVIFFVATRCRCPVTRRRTLALLARNPLREGLWDAESHIPVIKRVIEIEEAEIDSTTGWPVERTRLWSCVVDANMDRNGGFWVYFLPVGWVNQKTPDGKQKLRQEFFRLDTTSSAQTTTAQPTPFGDSVSRF